MRFSKIASMLASAPTQDATAPEDVWATFKCDRDRMEKSARRCLLGSALVAVICPTAATAAQDPGVYPGAACQPYYSSNTFRHNYGGVYNNSSETQDWVCPVARDFEDSGSIEYAQVTVHASSSGRPNCDLRSITEEGKLYKIAAPRIYSTRTSRVYTLKFGLGPDNAINVVQYGSLYFYCSLPRDSGILNYRVTENVGED